jgi:hypothetical protein
VLLVPQLWPLAEAIEQLMMIWELSEANEWQAYQLWKKRSCPIGSGQEESGSGQKTLERSNLLNPNGGRKLNGGGWRCAYDLATDDPQIFLSLPVSCGFPWPMQYRCSKAQNIPFIWPTALSIQETVETCRSWDRKHSSRARHRLWQKPGLAVELAPLAEQHQIQIR